MVQITVGALRVVEAVWADCGDEPIGGLYTELGNRFHLEGDVSRAAVAGAIEASGLDGGYIGATDEDRWDAEIRGSMAEAIDLVSGDVGAPVMVLATATRSPASPAPSCRRRPPATPQSSSGITAWRWRGRRRSSS